MAVASGNGKADQVQTMSELLLASGDDPMEAFIVSPIPVNIRDLGIAWARTQGRDDFDKACSELRRRAGEERWHEKRSLHQSQRSAAKRDIAIRAEAQVWAVLAADETFSQLRDRINRRSMLAQLVETGLERTLENGGQFNAGLRDAMRELRELEDAIKMALPDVGVGRMAQQVLNKESDSRGAVLQRIKDRFETMEEADAGGNVVQLFEAARGGS